MASGNYSLVTATLTQPIAVPFTPIAGLNGANAITFFGKFIYGSGGLTVKVDIETSLDAGATWLQIARLAFAQANAQKVLVISAVKEILAAYAISALADDTAISGLIGDRIRANVTSTGIYAGGTLLDLRMNVR